MTWMLRKTLLVSGRAHDVGKGIIVKQEVLTNKLCLCHNFKPYQEKKHLFTLKFNDLK